MPENEKTARRVLAAWRARACGAAIAVGASVFAVGAGVLVPTALNAAWLCALPCVPLGAAAAYWVRRKGPSRLRCALAGASLFLSCILLCAAAVSLAQQALTVSSPAAFTSFLTAAAVFCCALSGGAGVSRVCFALRFALPALLFALCVQATAQGSYAGIFPLLGAGRAAVLRGMIMAPGALAPVLLLALPPEEAQKYDIPAPPPRFFARRIALGALCGVLMTAALSLCSDYTLLAGMEVWGGRMRIVSSGYAGEDLFKALMTLLQTAAFVLGAAACLSAAHQAGAAAAPFLAGKKGLVFLAALLWLALEALVRFGFSIVLAAAPFLAFPALLALLSGRGVKG